MFKTLRQLQHQTRLLKNIGCTVQEFRRVETHRKCRSKFYPGTQDTVTRFRISSDEVSWSSQVHDPPYDPPSYTAKVVLDGPEWADPDADGVWFERKPRWNMNDGQSYNRQCGSHLYAVNNSIPLNPIGRTGIQGRGLLGRWGPNHAVHLILARWNRCSLSGAIKRNRESGKPSLEVLSVFRDDAREWSLPGRFLRKAERIGVALKRCFIEECLDNLKLYETERERVSVVRRLNLFFGKIQLIYRGYIDDPRNTDNAWVSSNVLLAFDDSGNITNNLVFRPGGSNILDIKWLSTKRLPFKGFYANLEEFVNDTARILGAHYPPPLELVEPNMDLSFSKTAVSSPDTATENVA